MTAFCRRPEVLRIPANGSLQRIRRPGVSCVQDATSHSGSRLCPWMRLVLYACQHALRWPPQEPRVAVKVREHASRRAVKQTVDAVEAEARAQKVAE